MDSRPNKRKGENPKEETQPKMSKAEIDQIIRMQERIKKSQIHKLPAYQASPPSVQYFIDTYVSLLGGLKEIHPETKEFGEATLDRVLAKHVGLAILLKLIDEENVTVNIFGYQNVEKNIPHDLNPHQVSRIHFLLATKKDTSLRILIDMGSANGTVIKNSRTEISLEDSRECSEWGTEIFSRVTFSEIHSLIYKNEGDFKKFELEAIGLLKGSSMPTRQKTADLLLKSSTEKVDWSALPTGKTYQLRIGDHHFTLGDDNCPVFQNSLQKTTSSTETTTVLFTALGVKDTITPMAVVNTTTELIPSWEKACEKYVSGEKLKALLDISDVKSFSGLVGDLYGELNDILTSNINNNDSEAVKNFYRKLIVEPSENDKDLTKFKEELKLSIHELIKNEMQAEAQKELPSPPFLPTYYYLAKRNLDTNLIPIGIFADVRDALYQMLCVSGTDKNVLFTLPFNKQNQDIKDCLTKNMQATCWGTPAPGKVMTDFQLIQSQDLKTAKEISAWAESCGIYLNFDDLKKLKKKINAITWHSAESLISFRLLSNLAPRDKSNVADDAKDFYVVLEKYINEEDEYTANKKETLINLQKDLHILILQKIKEDYNLRVQAQERENQLGKKRRT